MIFFRVMLFFAVSLALLLAGKHSIICQNQETIFPSVALFFLFLQLQKTTYNIPL